MQQLRTKAKGGLISSHLQCSVVGLGRHRFQRKVFLSRASWGSHQRCWHRRAEGNAFEKSHPPPIKKNTTKHQKAPPTTTKPHLLHFSFMRARNTTKLRGRQATAAVCFHAQIKPLLRACSPTVSALLAGGRWDPWVRPTQQRASSSSPREIHPLVWLAGLLSPAVSRLVRAQSCVQTCEISHSLGMLGAASITSPTHPSPFRLKGHPHRVSHMSPMCSRSSTGLEIPKKQKHSGACILHQKNLTVCPKYNHGRLCQASAPLA